MRLPASIRARVGFAAAAVLVVFLAAAGYAVQRAHAESVRTAHFARLQGTVYLLLAAAEVDAQGQLAMPQSLTDPRLALPGSGLYASIVETSRGSAWRSPSSVGRALPFPKAGTVGDWKSDVVQAAQGDFLAVSYAVRWVSGPAPTQLVLSVLEDAAALEQEAREFRNTLWIWLGGAAVVLLVSQTLVLRWGLAPLGRVAAEIQRVERGEHGQVEGRYPTEIAALTDNINALIEHERVRQDRYREGLSFLAHSLKTPLAVLRAAPAEPQQLAQVVSEQVARMDDIVQYQLGRAASGTSLFAPPLALAPILERIRRSLAKVHAQQSLDLRVDCPVSLQARIAEGDAFELCGNLMDNAAKWARHRIDVRAWREGKSMHLLVEDDGPGFSDTTSVLQLHVRGDERVPGHGVGLAVVSELVTAYGGELQLGRSDLGGGRVAVRLQC